ncbi:hypothetical protein COT72_04880 [archaeon CG10_big_fil_rev_8_21_14_0_10_43_11]|nr:MAG: hypothetical protein COT72_04880 [archaeon CG10_big_fil_rev_8_21_14_0_10_43_11]
MIISITSVHAQGVTPLEYSEARAMSWLIRISNFDVSPDTLFVNALLQNQTSVFVTITNDGDESFPRLEIGFEGNISPIMQAGFSAFPLERKSAYQTMFLVNATRAGLYTGNITFDTGVIKKHVPAIISVSENERTTANIEILGNVKAGRNLNAKITIDSGFITEVTLSVTYGIQTVTGQKIGENTISARVSGTSTSQLAIPVPNSVGVGDYFFYAIVDFNGRKYIDAQHFEITTILSFETLIITAFLLIILAVVLGSILQKKEKTIAEYAISSKNQKTQ